MSQVFDPLDFLAAVTQHIPDTGEYLIRYYGFYSNKSRGWGVSRRAAMRAGMKWYHHKWRRSFATVAFSATRKRSNLILVAKKLRP
jgi:hypothetical protein